MIKLKLSKWGIKVDKSKATKTTKLKGTVFPKDSNLNSTLDMKKEESINKNNMFEFTEWVGTYFIKMHGGWMRNYADQRDKNNLISTEYLYNEYLNSLEQLNKTPKK